MPKSFNKKKSITDTFPGEKKREKENANHACIKVGTVKIPTSVNILKSRSNSSRAL